MPDETVAVVMAGGMGERLRPLTDIRTKPAVPFGGIYRIVDFTLSNCVNSGIRRIVVLTQYKSHSLSNHLKSGWNFLSRRLGHFIDEIPAQMQMGSQWYKGTADAIRQNMAFIESAGGKQVLILSGDHIYKMDYRQMMRFHAEKQALATVSTVRVDVDQARGNYGVLEADETGRIVGFEEKPAEPKAIPGTHQCLASMGIYLFDHASLQKCLATGHDDFGRDILPELVSAGERIYAFDYSVNNTIPEYEYVTREGQRIRQLVDRASDSDYWRDVGTLDSFWAANLDLVSPRPRFNLYGERWPIFCNPGHFPPAKFVHEAPGRTGEAINSIVGDGVIVSGALVRNSVLSNGVYVHSYTLIENSVLLGGTMTGGLRTETAIGRHCRIRNAIIDKNVLLPSGTVIGYNRDDDDRRGLKTSDIPGTSDYLVAVPKGYTVS